jgi:hypothetical protein
MKFAVDALREGNEARWEKDEVLKNAIKAKFDALCTRIDSLVNRPTTPEAVRAEANKLRPFLPKMIIQRKVTDPFWGTLMKVLPKTNHDEISVKFPKALKPQLDTLKDEVTAELKNDYKERMQTWRRGGSKGPKPEIKASAFLRFARKARVVSSIPALIDRVHEYELTQAEVKEFGWRTDDNPDTNPFIDTVSEDRGKCPKYKFVEQLCRDLPDDHLGRKGKILVFAGVPGTAFHAYEVISPVYVGR